MAQPLSNNIRGILLMILATALLTSQTIFVRILLESLHPFQIAFLRSALGVLLMMPFLLRTGWAPLKTNHLGLMVFRGGFNAVAMILYFLALALLPIAEVSALTFTSPLFLALLAVPFLGEKLGPRRIASLVVGFTGALIIIRPGFEVINIGVIYTLGSAAAWAVAVVAIKLVSRNESSLTITIYGLFFLSVFALGPAITVWRWPSLEVWGWLFAIAATGTTGQIVFAQSMKNADASLVMPFDFTKLIWASLFGFFIFAEIPEIWTYIGGAIIFASATYFTYRERNIGKPVPTVTVG